MNTNEIGRKAEEQACVFLKSSGYEVVARNWKCKAGEIDIIATESKVLHFVEVKKIPVCWDEDEISSKVDYAKMCKIKRTASAYLAQSGIIKYDEISFDVIAVSGNYIRHYKGAF